MCLQRRHRRHHTAVGFNVAMTHFPTHSVAYVWLYKLKGDYCEVGLLLPGVAYIRDLVYQIPSSLVFTNLN